MEMKRNGKKKIKTLREWVYGSFAGLYSVLYGMETGSCRGKFSVMKETLTFRERSL